MAVVLGYWKIRGLAERLRLLMEYTGVAYTEVKYTAEERDKWFQTDKPALIQKHPAITLPYLLDGDKVISESDAIILHVIFKSGKIELIGRTPEEQVGISTLMGVFRDLHSEYISLVYGRYGNDPFDEARKKYWDNFIPYLNKLQALIGDKQFAVGNLTFADFTLADFFQTLGLLYGEDFKTKYHKLVSYQERVFSLPAIAAYLKSDRYQERPCNSPMAKWA